MNFTSFKSYLPWVQTVRQHLPNEPLQFVDKENDRKLSVKTLIDEHVPEFRDHAQSTILPYLASGHAQTIVASMLSFESKHQIHYKRWLLHYPDGGEGALDIYTPRHLWNQTSYVPRSQKRQLLPRYTYYTPEETLGSSDSKPMLIILHGLTGGSNESYVRSLVDAICGKYGFEACVLNSRGCCQSSITSPSLYCGLWTDDVRHCVKELRARFPNRKLFLCGVSLGASMATNYLGQEGDSSDIELGVVLGNPWDLTASSYHLERNLIGKYAYSPALCKSLVNLTKSHLKELKSNPEMADSYANHLDEVNTVEQFDNFFTAKMFGFNTSFDYYRHGTSANRLCSLRTPLLILNALDDPIVGSESLPYREVECNPFITMLTTSRGGHIAWFDTKFDRWYVEPLCKLLYQYYTKISVNNLQPDVSSVTLPRPIKFENDRLIP